MKHGSLFSGIGGFDLAAQWMGWDNAFHCEWNDFGQSVLRHYWPESESFTDITKTDFTKYADKIDILTGGFPCQPYSVAGKRLGKEDDRHLWPEMLRAIREIKPRYILGENVSGVVNWSGGLVFEEVQTDLEAEGYEVQAVLLPVASVNAPHKRERVWFVAYCGSFGRDHGSDNREKRQIYNNINRDASQDKPKRSKRECRISEIREIRNATNADDEGLEGSKDKRSFKGSREDGKKQPSRCLHPNWEDFPTKSPIRGRDDGFSNRLDGITFPKWRNESIKGYGNAVAPPLVYEIFKVIEEIDRAYENKK